MEGLYNSSIKQQPMEEFLEDKIRVLSMASFYEKGLPTPEEELRVQYLTDFRDEYREKIERGMLVK